MKINKKIFIKQNNIFINENIIKKYINDKIHLEIKG